MEWDLGIRGLGTLLLMAACFAALAQLVMWRAATHWLWLIAGVTYFLAGLFVSEVWFGWATEEDLQPNIDGLSFDEVLLITPLFAITAIVATWFLGRRRWRDPERNVPRTAG